MAEPRASEHEGERTVWQGGPSQVVNLPVYLMLGLGVIVGTVGLLFLRSLTPADADAGAATSLIPWVIVVLWVVAGVAALVTYLKTSSTKYVLTTERLRITTGILSTVTEDLELRRVRDSIIVRPFWARMAGLGDVEILSSDASTPRTVLHAIRDPDGVQGKVRSIAQELYQKYRVGMLEVD